MLLVSQETAPPFLLKRLWKEIVLVGRKGGEEGGDDVKSACRLHPGLHTSYNGADNGLPSREAELIPKTASQWGLQAAIRLHERGIGSNRGSAGPGEYVLASCTHCPSSQQSWGCPKALLERDEGKPSDEG